MAAMVDLRCPAGMGKLLGRTAAVLHEQGQIELACSNCARARRAAGTPCVRVLHRFNLLGELLGTDVITPAPPRTTSPPRPDPEGPP